MFPIFDCKHITNKHLANFLVNTQHESQHRILLLEFFDGFLHQANLLPADRHGADTPADFCTGSFEWIRMRSHYGTPKGKWAGTGVVGLR